MYISSNLIVIVLLTLIFALIFCIVVLSYFLIKSSSKNKEKALPEMALNGPMAKKEQGDIDGICAICEEGFPENKLIEHDKTSFCKDHYQLFISHEWDVITNVVTSADSPEAAIAIYQIKNNLWCTQEVPSFIVTHYKINVEKNYIESHVQLFARECDRNLFLENLEATNKSITHS